ncbi:major capsid protein [Hydrogenophaga sp.]|uniref:major capsid protein n=1 Tax=Hydrogenophaga sp. TaxID=1904254 RepID=UPI00272193CC|nr:major capsid protein [Hydrogenophaga sp.]MDO8903970.1 major capsid protein [Hydrogenophaga sp.]
MNQMTPGQARAVDPILSEVARGYRSPKAAIASILFPIVTVTSRGGKIITFGPDDFKLVSTVRAPGTNTKRVQFGYAGADFSLVDYRLEAMTPYEIQEEAAAVPGIDLIAMSIRKVQNVMALEREYQASVLARNADNYGANNKETLSSTGQWSHVDSDPIADVMDAKEAIRQQIGERPNVMTLGPKVLTALRNHPKILARLSTAADRPPASIAQLQALFELEQVVEGQATYHDGAVFQDVWGKDAILAYTTPASLAEMGSPNYGYTYQLSGRPVVEEGYDDRNANSWVNPVADARKPVLAGASAGFIFKAAVA